jgi:hypothetical protein
MLKSCGPAKDARGNIARNASISREIVLTPISQGGKLPSEKGVFMRVFNRKSCQISLAFIIVCAAIYGIGYAAPGCCNELQNACFQASSRTQCDVAFGQECRSPLSAQPSQNQISLEFTDCCNPSETCCNAAKGHDSAQSIVFNPHPPQYHENANAIFEFVDPDKIQHKNPTLTNSLINRPSTPLYIQTESFLC